MGSRTVRPSPSRCPHAVACAAPQGAHPPAGVSLRVSLRTPALRWAAAALVAVAGRCTVVAHMEPLPTQPAAGAPAAPPPAAQPPTATP